MLSIDSALLDGCLMAGPSSGLSQQLLQLLLRSINKNAIAAALDQQAQRKWLKETGICCGKGLAAGRDGRVGSAKVLQPNAKIVGLATPETLKPMIVFLQFDSSFRTAFNLSKSP
jgi:hypothetical protein